MFSKLDVNGDGGMFAKIETLLDQYRSNATGSTDTAKSSALSVAA